MCLSMTFVNSEQFYIDRLKIEDFETYYILQLYFDVVIKSEFNFLKLYILSLL